MSAARAWVLNLDAENDLACGSRQTPSRVELERIRAWGARLRGTLIPDGDAVLWPDGEAVRAGARAMAWCPTPWALEQLRAAGATSEGAPTREVLRRVNHRAWAAGLGVHLPRARYVNRAEAMREALAEPWPARGWLLKRPLGFAGRGRLHLRALDEALTPRNAQWIDASMTAGGVMLEPMVDRVLDLGLHGFLDRDAGLSRGFLTRQICDARGAWVSSEVFDPRVLVQADLERFEAVFDETAEALVAAGYHGPFNLDAYVYFDDERRLCMQPRSEVNARYSMGWAVGMGRTRPDLE